MLARVRAFEDVVNHPGDVTYLPLRHLRIAKSLLFLDQFLTQPLDVPIQPFVLTLEIPPLRCQRFRWR